MPENCKVLLEEAYNMVLSSFLSSAPICNRLIQYLKATDALAEFFILKSKERREIQYKHEDLSDGNKLCFVFLPNGNCFANFEVCSDREEARQSSAKIAFINSVFNEDPSKLIDAKSINKILKTASFSFVDNFSDQRALNTFKIMLERHIGDTMLDLQYSITTFQLLQWNNEIKDLKSNGCTIEEVFDHYCHKKIDKKYRMKLCNDWVKREMNQPGVIATEIRLVEAERDFMIKRGKECRFVVEKYQALKQAQNALLYKSNQ